MQSWKVGSTLKGEYQIVDTLGSGGFGITYLATKKDTKQQFAIKSLNATVQAKKDFNEHQERFVKEAFILAKCHHDHIIKVHDVFQQDNLWCMIMDYIQGDNLAEYIEDHGIFKEEDILKYIGQIGSALDYFHTQQNALHRDIKPQNILLIPSQQKAVLIDFGLAREFTQDKTKTHTNSLTECYAPIEQYQLKAKRGAYTDVYALAATLYYCLTAQLPIPAQFRSQGFNVIPPQQHNPKISKKVNDAILKGMEFFPENRPQTIKEWLALLPISQPNSPLPQGGLGGIKTAKCDYTKLRDLLAAGKWQEADQETLKVMLKVANREKEGWLDVEDCENFSREDIKIIDQLWLKYSNGKFGFSVQKQIWKDCGGTPGEYNSDVYVKFCDKIGWRKNGNRMNYSDLTFSTNALHGHLPCVFGRWGLLFSLV
jgi:eukaryotic-like serine/threonine-protein kinase